MAERRTQAERRAATRAALLSAARPLFAERGYEAVSSEEIVAAAGVTRGALYHHFDGKRGLFAAVFEEVESEFAGQLRLLRAREAIPPRPARRGRPVPRPQPRCRTSGSS